MSKLMKQMGQKMVTNLKMNRSGDVDKVESVLENSVGQDDSGMYIQNYVSYEDGRDETAIVRRGTYKGFSTSMNSMFQSEQDCANDCCSVAWFGMLQADRNRHVVNGSEAPAFSKRVLVHLLIPATIFMAAGMSSLIIRDPFINQFFVWVFFICFLGWIVTACFRGRAKRIRAREEVIWKFHQIAKTKSPTKSTWPSQSDPPNMSDEKSKNWASWQSTGPYGGQSVENIQSHHDLACASSCIGCYAKDCDDEQEDIQYGYFQWLTWLCCGKLFGCWIQCCGCCAIAQEGREIQRLLPKQYIDYITFQPFVQYVNKIRALRISKDSSFSRHAEAMSRLSIRFIKILKVIVIFSILVGIAGTFFQASFSWKNTIVFLGIWVQSFFLLYIIHWRKNSMNISLDAVIKYFACGFLICTFLAIMFESMVHFPVEIFLNLILRNTMVTEAYNSMLQITMDITPLLWSAHTTHSNNAYGISAKVDFLRRHLPLMVIYLFFKAYMTAALVEELCKYFSYRMVEHPDFLSEKQLIDASNTLPPSCSTANQRPTVDDDSDGDSSDEEDLEVGQQVSSPSQDPCNQTEKSNKNEITTIDPVSILPGDDRNVEVLGSAVTVAMCSVALGFACCENMIYIYLYTPPVMIAQLAVLLLRSFFPIHPVCAAIQSIYVCQRDLEKDSSVTLKRIIFPALLLHGTFDFVMMFLGAIHAMNNYQNTYIHFLSLGTGFVIMLSGLLFYFSESQKQKDRLRHLSLLQN